MLGIALIIGVSIVLIACTGGPAEKTSQSIGSPAAVAPSSAPSPEPAPAVATPTVGEPTPGVGKIKTPDVVGLEPQSAKAYLSENHLVFKWTMSPANADVPLDNTAVVVKQKPTAGTVIDYGSTVTLTIKKK